MFSQFLLILPSLLSQGMNTYSTNSHLLGKSIFPPLPHPRASWAPLSSPLLLQESTSCLPTAHPSSRVSQLLTSTNSRSSSFSQCFVGIGQDFVRDGKQETKCGGPSTRSKQSWFQLSKVNPGINAFPVGLLWRWQRSGSQLPVS